MMNQTLLGREFGEIQKQEVAIKVCPIDMNVLGGNPRVSLSNNACSQ